MGGRVKGQVDEQAGGQGLNGSSGEMKNGRGRDVTRAEGRERGSPLHSRALVAHDGAQFLGGAQKCLVAFPSPSRGSFIGSYC